MKVLVTGASGRLGSELVKVFPACLRPSHHDLDITDFDSVRQYMRNEVPDIIIHMAALTNVEECEIRRQRAYEVNVKGTENLVKSCSLVNIDTYFVYVSSACVFDGHKGDFVETDLPYPRNYYGLTKLLGETVVQSSPLPWLIVRTNFVAREKWRHEKAFTDRFGTYLFADDVAKALGRLVEEKSLGVIHICGDQKMSMHDLTKMTTPNVKPMTLRDYKGIVDLTVDMSLKSNRIPPLRITRETLCDPRFQ